METQCDLYSFIVSNTKMRRKSTRLYSIGNTMNECCLLCDKQENWLDKMVGAILYWVVRCLQLLTNRDTTLNSFVTLDFCWFNLKTDSKKDVVFWQKIWFFLFASKFELLLLLLESALDDCCQHSHFLASCNLHSFLCIRICYGKRKFYSQAHHTHFEKYFSFSRTVRHACVHEKTVSISILFTFFSIILHQTNHFSNEEFIY